MHMELYRVIQSELHFVVLIWHPAFVNWKTLLRNEAKSDTFLTNL